MKQRITSYLLATGLAIAGLAMTSCEQFNEVPPQVTRSIGESQYKLPPPTLLNDAEHAAIQAIQTEYRTGTAN